MNVKKFVVILAVVAFGALAFGDEAPAPAAGNPTTTTDAAKPADTTKEANKDTAMSGKKTAKKGKHHGKKAKSEDKAM